MAVGLPFFHRGHLMVGDVCAIQLTASGFIEPESDERLLSILRETEGQFEPVVRERVRAFLGPKFEVARVQVTKGSITIWVVLTVVGVVYMTVSRYKSFRESLQLLVADLRTFFEQFFRRSQVRPLYVTGSWSPGRALAPLEEALEAPTAADPTMVLLWYLILSHAALLITFLWQVIRMSGSR